jgi:hypothetical protein
MVMTTQSADLLRGRAVEVLVLCVGEIEWFHCMQHAEQSGKEADFTKLRMEKTVDEALKEKDPEMAIMVMVCNWLAQNGVAEAGPLDYVDAISDLDDDIEKITQYLEPFVAERAQMHIDILSALEDEKIDEIEAHRRMTENTIDLDKRIKESRVGRGPQAMEILRKSKQKAEGNDGDGPPPELLKMLQEIDMKTGKMVDLKNGGHRPKDDDDEEEKEEKK